MPTWGGSWTARGSSKSLRRWYGLSLSLLARVTLLKSYVYQGTFTISHWQVLWRPNLRHTLKLKPGSLQPWGPSTTPALQPSLWSPNPRPGKETSAFHKEYLYKLWWKCTGWKKEPCPFCGAKKRVHETSLWHLLCPSSSTCSISGLPPVLYLFKLQPHCPVLWAIWKARNKDTHEGQHFLPLIKTLLYERFAFLWEVSFPIPPKLGWDRLCGPKL